MKLLEPFDRSENVAILNIFQVDRTVKKNFQKNDSFGFSLSSNQPSYVNHLVYVTLKKTCISYLEESIFKEKEANTPPVEKKIEGRSFQ